MESTPIRRKRSLTSEAARAVRQRGYDDALEFALLIGLSKDYKNDPQAKKDVIDPSGDAHSVKGGQKKWQIFLYSRSRFESDDAFQAMNGIGDLLIKCIDSFPLEFTDYQTQKKEAKERLREPMSKLKEKLQGKSCLRAFLNKSLFNGGEVNYLTVKHNGIFHVFINKDVIDMFGNYLEICNSRAISSGQVPEQKVLFRYAGKNIGELEMRNDSEIHYREIRFNMIKPRVMKLLFDKIPLKSKYNDSVLVYGKAERKFGNWQK
jgi:hypothetical protein